MPEIDVSIKFLCCDKSLQSELKDIFDLTCRQYNLQGWVLESIDSNSHWIEFCRRIEEITPLQNEYGLIDSFK